MTSIRSGEDSTVTTNKLLEINNISVDYYAASGTVHALNDVSISLERGQILGLAGESGSGKSTLAYAVTRLLHPPAAITGGEVLYYPRSDIRRQRGKSAGAEESRTSTDEPIDILQLSPAQLRAFRWSELAIVFQSAMNALNPVLTIAAQINYVLRTHQPQIGPDSR